MNDDLDDGFPGAIGPPSRGLWGFTEDYVWWARVPIFLFILFMWLFMLMKELVQFSICLFRGHRWKRSQVFPLNWTEQEIAATPLFLPGKFCSTCHRHKKES